MVMRSQLVLVSVLAGAPTDVPHIPQKVHNSSETTNQSSQLLITLQYGLGNSLLNLSGDPGVP